MRKSNSHHCMKNAHRSKTRNKRPGGEINTSKLMASMRSMWTSMHPEDPRGRRE